MNTSSDRAVRFAEVRRVLMSYQPCNAAFALMTRGFVAGRGEIIWG